MIWPDLRLSEIGLAYVDDTSARICLTATRRTRDTLIRSFVIQAPIAQQPPREEHKAVSY